ncbi:iron chelate uptake ABC transporter family permease subunit [Kocuria sp.]|uniref:FecCD family ABC transporter permease n=1 Tax=Kocuria sp. TaxID=1871328 RepID=UPI0026DC9A66|nr:iron ABC transporter permease [Kocuria sp.]MDO4918443.1 iron ABC transporter permease [Kocuria sp.]
MSTTAVDRSTSRRTASAPASGSVAAVRAGRARARRRTLRVTLALAVALLLASFARIALGKFTVAVPDLVAVLSHDYTGPANYIVWEITLPRTVLGILTGIAFGLAGHLFQRVLRNPLASPDIMGVSSGAGLGAVVAITLGGLSGMAVTVSALVGGFGLMLAVILAAGGTRANIGKLVLTGVAGGALTAAAINGVLTRADIYAAQDAMQWLTGSLNAASWVDIAQVALCLLVLLPLSALLTPSVDALGTGDSLASGLGVRVQRARLTALTLAVVLVAVAAATVGPVAFVSFLAAPIARGLGRGAGSAHHAALVGALLMVVSDYVAAEAIPGLALPVGVVTAAAGAPALLWLLIGRGKAEA